MGDRISTNYTLPQFTGNREADLQTFMKTNNISDRNAAISYLNQYGPDAQQNSVFSSTNNAVWTGGMGTALPMVPHGAFPIQSQMLSGMADRPAPQSPEQMSEYVQKFAEANGISEKDAASILGLPDRDEQKPSETSSVQSTASDSTTLAASETTAAASSSTDAAAAQTVSTADAVSNSTKPEESSKDGKMSRKEANAWVKNYRKEHNCSKKEAKEAFKNTFGYEVPKSAFSLGNILVGVLSAGIVAATAKAIGRG